ncbi:MAG: hypothetical protein ACLUKN_06360 [Bacilli bacterium]
MNTGFNTTIIPEDAYHHIEINTSPQEMRLTPLLEEPQNFPHLTFKYTKKERFVIPLPIEAFREITDEEALSKVQKTLDYLSK